MTGAEPAAMASVGGWVGPSGRGCSPELGLVPAPLVVAAASVVAPWVIETVNWSAATARLETDFTSVSWGAGGVLVMVQVMLSPLAGVTENDVPLPDGSVVLEPPAVLVHEIEL